MPPFSEEEIEKLSDLVREGKPLPDHWRQRVFPSSSRNQNVGKEYRLVYDGKLTREEVLAQTPAAPWQLEREFCKQQPHGDGWRNLLVWGDNLLALRELLADQQGPNRLGTRGKIKLIYIDPPFATRQDFMKDKEKAYRDKVLGAQFIEFLRRRLILLREVLADDGSIYVHLDTKKGHYIKAALDEVFGEENFRNEIVWKRGHAHSDTKQGSAHYGRLHDSILFYSKSDRLTFNQLFNVYSQEFIARYYKFVELETGRRYWLDNLQGPGGARKGNPYYEVMGVSRYWRYSQETMSRLISEGRIIQTSPGTVPKYKRYLDEMPGRPVQSVWDDIKSLGGLGSNVSERLSYPTQKPEALLDRIIQSSSNEGDIVLDCFGGSGTVAAAAEKLGRRWIAMDCGKLAIYTTQNRLFSLTTSIGSSKTDNRLEPARVEDWAEHLKKAPGVLLITEKARKGECEVTLELLHELAALVVKHRLVKKDTPLSLVCPEAKLRIPEDQLEDAGDGPGTKRIEIEGVEFRISIIAPKNKPEKEQPLPAKEFALYRAGVYDMAAIKGLPWEDYRPFVMKLFGVQEDPHQRYGMELDGYIGTHSALLWNYPDHPNLTLDHEYVKDLHRMVRGKKGERFYVIAPVVAMDFAEDEVTEGKTTYVFLKVPISVLLRLLEHKEPAALKQPAKEDAVNEVIDAVGFDFISQPQVQWKAKKARRKGEMFYDYVLEITEFRAQTLATDPEDFQNFETFSMAMVDLDYNGDVFQLDGVVWGEELIKAAGGLEKATSLELRIEEQDFKGEQMMVILCDRYGNEKALLLKKGDFKGGPAKAKKKATKKATKKKVATKKATAKKKGRKKA